MKFPDRFATMELFLGIPRENPLKILPSMASEIEAILKGKY